jgi:elongation factor P
MINSQEIKNGMCLKIDGQFYFVIEFLHVKPGKGNTFMRTKMKNVKTGKVLERTFQIGFKLEDVRIDKRPYQFLYKEGDDAYVFMNQETFEQINIEKQQIEGVDFLKEGDVVDVVSNDDNVLYAELAPKVALKITYTEPGLKGDTATNALKPATVETGATVRVPLFINNGEEIIVDTRDGSYVERANPSIKK